jgi:hypothetical protein
MKMKRNQLCLADSATTDLQRQWLELSPLPNLFAVVSWGCSATVWLARALDAHEDIFCAHAVNHIWREFTKAQMPDDLSYLRVLALQGWTYRAVGEVHGIGRGEVPKLRSLLGDAFEAVVLTRDPMARLASQIALYTKSRYVGWGDLAYIDEVAARHLIDPATLSKEQRHFIHAVECLNVIVEEQKVGRIFRMEDVTDSPKAFAELVTVVTRGQVEVRRRWAAQMVKTKPANSHRSRYQHPRFQEWEEDIIRRCITQEAWQAYRELGYTQPSFV